MLDKRSIRAKINFPGCARRLTTDNFVSSAPTAQVIAGSDHAFASVAEAREWIEDPANACAYPVIVKAAMGGGGRGIRVVPTPDDLEGQFAQAANEALTAFGDGRMFVEKYVETPRHIEVQCLGDGTGRVVHLWDRDCSVQRRHQKIIETVSEPRATAGDCR